MLIFTATGCYAVSNLDSIKKHLSEMSSARISDAELAFIEVNGKKEPVSIAWDKGGKKYLDHFGGQHTSVNTIVFFSETSKGIYVWGWLDKDGVWDKNGNLVGKRSQTLPLPESEFLGFSDSMLEHPGTVAPLLLDDGKISEGNLNRPGFAGDQIF